MFSVRFWPFRCHPLGWATGHCCPLIESAERYFMSQGLWCLKRCDLFRQLTAGQIRRIETSSRCRSFPAVSPIYLPSEKADSVFLLASGLMFAPLQREEYVEAVESSMVLRIPTEEMRRLMAERADVALAITKN